MNETLWAKKYKPIATQEFSVGSKFARWTIAMEMNV
jgi:hypothetical protein